jgi:hypothetical protein
MSSNTSRRMTIGDSPLRRLQEAGVRHPFGVPGDYNLELLRQLQDTMWVCGTAVPRSESLRLRKRPGATSIRGNVTPKASEVGQ